MMNRIRIAGRRAGIAAVVIAVWTHGRLYAAEGQPESRRNHETYDFHFDVMYPPYGRSDVGRDKVTQKGTGDVAGYDLRVVEWWPKHGVDVIPIEDIPGAPLRTWTPRKDRAPNFFLDHFPTEPFDAHLVGFRGLGDPYPQDPEDPDSYHCPAAVLRFTDGRKRIILGKYLCPEDRRFLMDIYMKDRKRIDQTLLDEAYHPTKKALTYALGEEHLHKPGKVRFDTKHFSLLAGAQSDPSRPSEWVNVRKPEAARARRNHMMSQCESYWAYMEYAGCHMRYWKDRHMQKYTVSIGGTLYDGYRYVSHGNGGGYGGCTIAGPNMDGIFHEWGHGMETGSILSLGGGETSADTLQIVANPANIHKAEHQIRKPWKNLFHGAYPGGGGYEILADDPNWGYAVVPILLSLAGKEDTTPVHVLAGLGEERGLWPKGQGIRYAGDLMGQIGARFAEFDCQQEYQFRQHFGSANRSYLVPIDIEKRLYRCPSTEAPEPFGVSISRLKVDPGEKEITVDFRGRFDPETFSDWRACLVAVDRAGKCRYSPLWNKGRMSMNVEPGDKRFWLTVTATPTALYNSAWIVYQSGFAYRYPYEVILEGCTPGPVLGSLADNNNTTLAAPAGSAMAVYQDRNIQDLPPLPHEPEYEPFVKGVKELLAHAEAELATVDRDADASKGYWEARRIRNLDETVFRCRLLLDDLGGDSHPNGGGWVSKKSFAAPSAYVGPNCMVLGGARVLDRATLIDGAVAIGEGAIVRDHAKLSGKAAIVGHVEAGGYARLMRQVTNRVKPGTAPIDILVMTIDDVPQRIKNLSANGLWANYECRRAETVLFEDLLKERQTGGFFLGHHTEGKEIFLDGVLVGQPGFEKTGRADGAVLFDGNSQHAELDAAAADLGEIMVCLRVRPEGNEGTLFDFGSAPANCFRLALDNNSPVLSWIADGKQDSIAGKETIAEGEWTDLRVEIDGKRAALFVNNKQVASKDTSFRPADAFPGHLGRHNFVFRSRDEKEPDYMKGALDHLRIYSVVAEDYAALPDPPVISPVKAMPEVVEILNETYGDREYRKAVFEGLLQNSHFDDKARSYNDRMMLRFREYERGCDEETLARTKALRDRVYRLEAEVALAEFEVKAGYEGGEESRAALAKKEELEKELDTLKTRLLPLRKALDEENKRNEAKWQEMLAEWEKSPDYRDYKMAYDGVQAERDRHAKLSDEMKKKAEDIRRRHQDAVNTELAEVTERINELAGRIREREDLLMTEEGPVAEVFQPVVRRYAGLLEEARTNKAPAGEIRRLEGLLNALLEKRQHVFTLPRGTFSLDEGLRATDPELLRWRVELSAFQRKRDAELSRRLLEDDEYIEAAVRETHAADMSGRNARNQLLPLPEAPIQKPEAGEAAAKLTETEDEIRDLEAQLREFDLYPGLDAKVREAVGDKTERLGNLTKELNTVLARNALDCRPDEYRVYTETEYKRRFISMNTRKLWSAAADCLAGPEAPDDMGQLRAAVSEQKKWHTSCDDWDRMNGWEKNYDSLNHRVKRWLQRVKPYRYGRKQGE